MTQDDIKSAFQLRPEEQKTLLLAMLAHELTIHARGAYSVEDVRSGNVAKLRAFNEILHRVTSSLSQALAGERRRYPDDVLIDVLFDVARHGDCSADLSAAFDRCFQYSKAVAGSS